jgi:hypothetical protein
MATQKLSEVIRVSLAYIAREITDWRNAFGWAIFAAALAVDVRRAVAM